MYRGFIIFSFLFILSFPLLAEDNTYLKDLVELVESENAPASKIGDLGAWYMVTTKGHEDNEKALQLLTSASEQGDGIAQYNLGRVYFDGKIAPQNFEISYAWFKTSEAQGHELATDMVERIENILRAQNIHLKAAQKAAVEHIKLYAETSDWSPPDLIVSSLSHRNICAEQIEKLDFSMCENPKGCPEKYFSHFEDNPEILYAMGAFYFGALGVDKNEAAAFKFFEKAAQSGHLGSRVYMGYMYYSGKGVKRDYTQSYAWYKIAAQEDYWANDMLSDFNELLNDEEYKKADILSQEYYSLYVQPFLENPP